MQKSHLNSTLQYSKNICTKQCDIKSVNPSSFKLFCRTAILLTGFTKCKPVKTFCTGWSKYIGQLVAVSIVCSSNTCIACHAPEKLDLERQIYQAKMLFPSTTRLFHKQHNWTVSRSGIFYSTISRKNYLRYIVCSILSKMLVVMQQNSFQLDFLKRSRSRLVCLF